MVQKRQRHIQRSCHLTETEKIQLAIKWAALPKDRRGKRIGVAALEISFMVSPGYIRKCLDIRKILGCRPDGNPMQRKKRKDAGIPRKLTPEVQKAMATQAEEWGYDFTYDEMVDALFEQGIDVSNMTVWRHMRAEAWNTRCRNRNVPMLTEKHRTWRRDWATQQVDNNWEAWVDLDEKWFYAVKAWGTLKMPLEAPPSDTHRNVGQIQGS